MNLPSPLLIALVVGVPAYLGVLYSIDQFLGERTRVPFRYMAAAATVALLFFILQRYVPGHDRAVDWAKFSIAMTAAGCVFYEAYRQGARRPVSERWKKFVGVTLGVAAIVTYFNGFKISAPGGAGAGDRKG